MTTTATVALTCPIFHLLERINLVSQSVQLITAPNSGGSNSKTIAAANTLTSTSVKSSTESLSSIASVPTLTFALPADDEAEDVGVVPIVEQAVIPETSTVLELTPTEEIASITEVLAVSTSVEPADRDVVFSMPSFFELSDFETDDEELAVDDVFQQRWAMLDHLRS